MRDSTLTLLYDSFTFKVYPDFIAHKFSVLYAVLSSQFENWSQYIAVQHNKTQQKRAQHSTTKHNTTQCSPLVLFIILYKGALTFEPVDETLKCGHSDET